MKLSSVLFSFRYVNSKYDAKLALRNVLIELPDCLLLSMYATSIEIPKPPYLSSHCVITTSKPSTKPWNKVVAKDNIIKIALIIFNHM